MNEKFESLRNSGLSNEDLKKILEQVKNTEVNVLLIGGTGAGKSSTVNALFATQGSTMQHAAVGETARPETMEVVQHRLKNLVIWDTPGLGDSAEKDKQHCHKIEEALQQKDGKGRPLIDLVLLVLDGSSRDFGSAYTLIKNVVGPQLAIGDENRLLIGINKADKIMHHKFWDEDTNQPKPELTAKLEAQAHDVKQRIQDDTGFSPDVVYYSAGEWHEGQRIQEPYNLLKLLSFVLDHLPNKKRAALANDINRDEDNFKSNDAKADYQAEVKKSVLDSLGEIASDVLQKAGSIIGTVLSDPKVTGLLLTAATGFIESLLSPKKDKKDK